MDMIFTIGIFTSLFFFVLLLNKKNKRLPDRILSIWMLVIGIHLVSTYLSLAGYWEIYPHLIGVTAPFPLLYGPLLYLYIAYSIKDSDHISSSDYLHFFPFILAYLYLCRFYFFYTSEEKRLVDKGDVDDFGIFSIILTALIIISAIGYAFISFKRLKRYQHVIEDNFSNIEDVNLNWLKGFIWGVFIIFSTVAIVIVTRDLVGITYPLNPDFIFYSMIIFAILSLGYFGIRHQSIFTDNVILEVEEDARGTYKSSSLKEGMAADKHKELVQLMDEQKLYLQSNLTLNTLAEKLDISLHHLSQIINQYEGQNFNDFVNKYRVEEFIKLASDETHLSFLALALDSGFNSKSTFNAVFRKHKGVTPSQFIAALQEAKS